MATRVTDTSETLIDHVIFEKASCHLGSVIVEEHQCTDHKYLMFEIFKRIKVHQPKKMIRRTFVDHHKLKTMFEDKISGTQDVPEKHPMGDYDRRSGLHLLLHSTILLEHWLVMKHMTLDRGSD
ncbi:hypothetical protein WA026_004838 [Henosepilachna vigintioctopunctata]|uniref:Uncharacterized protein n=1 Tax=Henosepilachna vigintioctopunctata TaxID=420089 RepID=A0AAW1UTT4_9CUCU